jgi:hypothetical protein
MHFYDSIIIEASKMNRFVRFFKRLFVPELTHDAAQEAEKRKKIAKGISDDQIYVQTVRNALKVPEATLSDKLTFAFSSLPEATTNFPFAKDMFIDILDYLMSNEEISVEEVELFKRTIENIGSFEDLMMIATA